jgi:hypothetical protein
VRASGCKNRRAASNIEHLPSTGIGKLSTKIR